MNLYARNMIKNVYSLLTALLLCLFVSCADSGLPRTVAGNDLFTVPYGRFDDQLNLFSLASVGAVRTYMAMNSGFFYIANGESKKIMELNSYGDLITLLYNADDNVAPDFVPSDMSEAAVSTRKAVAYPFNTLGPVAVDSRKYLYAVDTLPKSQQIRDNEKNTMLDRVIVCFSSDGTFIDYIGQNGPGGTPFPFIDAVYTTDSNELVVVCVTNDGPLVYWFSADRYLKYIIPVKSADVPDPFTQDENTGTVHVSVEKVIPARSGYELFVKVDYSVNYVDQDSKVQSGIDYAGTRVYPLDAVSGTFGEPYSIPAFEHSVTQGFSRISYSIPYDFMGVTSSGWLFFSIATDNGFMVQMIQPDGQRILKRNLEIGSDNLLYHSFFLSDTGIITGIFADDQCVSVKWWRMDDLINVISRS